MKTSTRGPWLLSPNFDQEVSFEIHVLLSPFKLSGALRSVSVKPEDLTH